MKIEASISTLEYILADNKRFYQIPDYQRPYSWDKEILSSLMDDLFNAFTQNKEEDYFCGSLVLVMNEKDKRFDIIDGQQRMTTFIILARVLKALYIEEIGQKAKDFIEASIQDRYEETKRKLRFLTSEQNQLGFEQDVLKELKFKKLENKIEGEFKDNKYLQNAHYFKNILSSAEWAEINKNDFIVWMYEKIVLTLVICPSQDSAIKIFGVLNDRGMPLNAVDILKASLMRDLSDEDKKAFIATWNELDKTMKNENLSLYSLFDVYLYFNIAKNPEQRLDKELLNYFKKHNKKALEIIHEIANFSKSYIEVLKMKDKYIYCLKYLGRSIYYTSILTAAKFIEYKHFDGLKQMLLSYYYKNWIAGNTVATIKSTSFKILEKVKNHSELGEIKQIIQENMHKKNVEENFMLNLESSYVYGERWVKPILLMLEYFASDDNNHDFIPINDDTQIEHILPEKYKAYKWDEIFTEEQREEWTYSLANLTLLRQRKNVQSSNYDFKTKKEIYTNKEELKTCYHITRDLAYNYDEWNVAALEKRKKWLKDKISKILSI